MNASRSRVRASETWCHISCLLKVLRNLLQRFIPANDQHGSVGCYSNWAQTFPPLRSQLSKSISHREWTYRSIRSVCTPLSQKLGHSLRRDLCLGHFTSMETVFRQLRLNATGKFVPNSSFCNTDPCGSLAGMNGCKKVSKRLQTAENAVPGLARVGETFIGKCHVPSAHFAGLFD